MSGKRFGLYRFGFVIRQTHFNDVSGAKDMTCADGDAASLNGMKHLEPPEGMLPKRKTAGDDAAHSLARVGACGGIGQNAHAFSSFQTDHIIA